MSRPRQRRHNHADLDLGAEAGAIDTGSYWAHTTRQTKRDAKRGLELAKLLDHDHEPVRNAMAIGQAGGVWTPLVVVTMTLENLLGTSDAPMGRSSLLCSRKGSDVIARLLVQRRLEAFQRNPRSGEMRWR